MSGSGRAAIKKASKMAVFALLRYSGVASLVRHTAQARRVSVLAYHDPDAETFERHLALLTALYSVIPLERYVSALREDQLHELPQRSLIITLDDGWARNLRLLPALERHGVRPAVFVSTAIVGTARHYWWTHVPSQAEQETLKRFPEEDRLRELAARGFEPEAEYADRQALSLGELAEMGRLVDLEAHSRSHPILPRCSDERAAWEIAGAADDLERLTGARPSAFSYPNGDCSDRDVELVRRAGYTCAFTMEPGYNDEGTDPLRLRRIFIEDDASLTELAACASGVYGILMRRVRGRSGYRSPT